MMSSSYRYRSPGHNRFRYFAADVANVGSTSITSLPALSTALPVFQRAVLDPHRQAATPAQACLIRRPVLHLERHLRDVVTAISVVFVRHRGGQNQKGNGILPPLQVNEMHQRPSKPNASAGGGGHGVLGGGEQPCQMGAGCRWRVLGGAFDQALDDGVVVRVVEED